MDKLPPTMNIFPSQVKVASQIRHLINVHVDSEALIRPHFFLTGPSGSGKSFLTKIIAEDFDIPYFEINAAQVTAEGLSGNSLSKALRPLREHWHKPNVIFIDEFDKLFQRNGETTEGFRSQVQDEFLHMLESTNASIFTDYGKYEPVKIENSLFIFAGAFSGQKIDTLDALRESGLRTEFVGRVPLVFSTEAITLQELKNALPDTDLFNRYLKMTKANKNKAIKDINVMLEDQLKQLDLGVRLLHSCIHQYFMRHIK